MNHQEILYQAYALHQREQLREAIAGYQRVLAAQPDHLHRYHEANEAIQAYRGALARDTDYVLGGKLVEAGRAVEGAAAHVHPNAWLSGAYYVRTEGVVGDAVDDLSGCLQVGAPDPEQYDTQDYEVRVFRPREGHLVVFPSYVWHRILPFEQRGTRISYAFDVVPVSASAHRHQSA